jgi:hypothetical protein
MYHFWIKNKTYLKRDFFNTNIFSYIEIKYQRLQKQLNTVSISTLHFFGIRINKFLIENSTNSNKSTIFKFYESIVKREAQKDLKERSFNIVLSYMSTLPFP